MDQELLEEIKKGLPVLIGLANLLGNNFRMAITANPEGVADELARAPLEALFIRADELFPQSGKAKAIPTIGQEFSDDFECLVALAIRTLDEMSYEALADKIVAALNERLAVKVPEMHAWTSIPVLIGAWAWIREANLPGNSTELAWLASAMSQQAWEISQRMDRSEEARGNLIGLLRYPLLPLVRATWNAKLDEIDYQAFAQAVKTESSEGLLKAFAAMKDRQEYPFWIEDLLRAAAKSSDIQVVLAGLNVVAGGETEIEAELLGRLFSLVDEEACRKYAFDVATSETTGPGITSFAASKLLLDLGGIRNDLPGGLCLYAKIRDTVAEDSPLLPMIAEQIETAVVRFIEKCETRKALNDIMELFEHLGTDISAVNKKLPTDILQAALRIIAALTSKETAS